MKIILINERYLEAIFICQAFNNVNAGKTSAHHYNLLYVRYQIPAMLAKGGSIVNIASILGQAGTKGSPAYVAAKHGVVGLTKAAALDYADKKIRINSVGPGYIKTPLVMDSLDDAARNALVGLHPMGRLGESEEIAELILWLGSPGASFVTGSYYPVDGGYLAQ